MRLKKEDTDLFYALWRPLLQAANEKQKIHPEMNAETDPVTEPQKMADIADWIWEHTEFLDEYVSSHPELSEDAREILLSWKRRVRNVFAVERHLKSGSVFIGGDNQVYLVQGLVSSFEELFWQFPMPVMIRATLIPFRDKITTDGLMSMMRMVIGPNMKKGMKEQYLEARRKKEIITSL